MSGGVDRRAVTVVPPGSRRGRVLDFRRRGAAAAPQAQEPARPLARAARRRRRGWWPCRPGVVAWVLTAPLFQLREVDVRPVKGAPHRPRLGGPRAPGARAAPGEEPGAAVARRRRGAAAAQPLDRARSRSTRASPTGCGVSRRRAPAGRPPARRRGDLVFADAEGLAIAPVASPAELGGGAQVRPAGGELRPRAASRNGMAAALKVAAELGRVEPNWAAHADADRGAGRGGLPAAHRRPALSARW